MKRRAKYVFLGWLRTLVNKLYPDYATSSYKYDNMEEAMEIWREIYADEPPWSKACHGKTLNLGATIASEFARLIMVEFESKITGSKRAEYLQKQYERLIKQLRVSLESACAVGGTMFKPYVRNGVILPDCITQDKFIPLGYSNGIITSAVFFNQEVKGKHYFTRVEKQTYSYDDKSHTIESHFFCSSSPDCIGTEIIPGKINNGVWSKIDPYILINDVDRPLFSFWKVPFANHIDDSSPLGVSVYSRAVKLLNEADLQWDRYLWEFQGGELAVDAGEEVLRQRPSEKSLETASTRDRLFRRINIDSDSNKDKSFYEVFNPNLRDENYARGLNEILRRTEWNCSLAYGTLSNPENVDKTAEEIKASKQRSYTAVSDMQSSLESVLEDYIYACNAMTDACSLAPTGEYETSSNWGDGVLEDKDKEQAIQLNEVNSGIRKKTDYLKWRYGVDDKQAAEMLPKTSSMFESGGT
ncbi:MAG: phage capsid protein [Ruminococcus bromii]|nr:phage capsid protein [Ruminococcus bromii]